MRETNTAKEAKTTQQDKGISQILSSEKRTWISVAFIWIGTMICIPMLMVGGLFASSLTMGSIFWATVIGFAICCLLMVLGGIIGSDLDSMPPCAPPTFGMSGANFSMALVVFIAEAAGLPCRQPPAPWLLTRL